MPRTQSQGVGSSPSYREMREEAAHRYVAMLDEVRTSLPRIERGQRALAPGVYHANWNTFVDRFGGTSRRAELLGQLRPALDVLAEHGIGHTLVGGSFMSFKRRPGDVDLAWMPTSHEQVRISEQVDGAVRAVAPDVHVYPASEVVWDADQLASPRERGINFAELLSENRWGRQRGIALLSTSPIDRLLPASPSGALHAALSAAQFIR